MPRTRRHLGNRAFCIAGPTDLRRGTACSFVFNHFQEPTQDSLIHSILLYNVIFEYCMLYGPLVVTLWTCYNALQIVVLLLLLLM